MAGLAQINIKFSADLRGFSTEMQNSIRTIGKLGTQLQNTGKNLSLYVSAPLIAAGAASVKFASDYVESVNKVDVAFGPAADSVKEFAKTSLESFGIAEGTALDLAATYGDMATALGLPVQKASDMSQALVGLAGDLASFKNISIDIANTALTSIFTGETESLKKLGIVMTEANLSAFALSKGITKQVKDMSQAEKVQLRYNFVLEKTKNAQGDFARTGGGAANQMRIFQESLKQIAQQLGAVILPTFTKLITYVNGVIKSFSGLSDSSKTTIVVVAGLVAAVGPLLSVFGSVLTFIPNLITKFNALKDAFLSLNALIVANPYAALAVGIAAVVAGLALWYANTKKIVSGQEALNNAIKDGEKAAATEVGTLDRLYQKAIDVSASTDERKAAIDRLQQLYPAYFKNIDSENIKNGQAIGVYKELRNAIFDKARATAIENELQKRANERIQKELQLKENIAKTEAEIERLKKSSATSTIQEGSAGDKSLKVTESRTNLLAAQIGLLKLQKAELEKFTADALASDDILLKSKSEYDLTSAKLAENEAQRQKDLIASNELKIESGNKLKASTIAYYESLIDAAQKEQKEVSTTAAQYDVLQSKIDAYQKKIDAIAKGGIKLPKVELPTLEQEGLFTPSFSLTELDDQLAYYEGQQRRFSKNSEQFKYWAEKINQIKIQIGAIEGVETATTELNEFQNKLVQFTTDLNSAIQQSVVSFAEGIASSIGAALSSGKNLAQSFTGLIFSTLGGLLIQLGKIAIQTAISITAIKKSLQTLNPVVAFVAGFAAIAIGTAIQNQVSNLGAFADGGIVGGSSFYGDKILARVNSGELILNQKQQKNLNNQLDAVGSSSTIIPDVRISGSDLLIIFDRAQNKKNRLG